MKRISRGNTRGEDDERCYNQQMWRRSDSEDPERSRCQSRKGHREPGKWSQSETPTHHLCRSAPPRAAQRQFAWPDEESPSDSVGARKQARHHGSSHSEHTTRMTENSDSAEYAG